MTRSLKALRVLVILQLIAGCLAIWAPRRAAAAEAAFTAIDSPLDGYQTEDLGVVDANGDGRLDLFTSNHDFAASLRLATAAGGFDDVTDDWTFGIDPDLPGLEPAWAVPLQQGLHIFFKARDLVFRLHGSPPGARPLRGRVTLPRPTKWMTDSGVHVVVADADEMRAGRARVVEFVASGDGQLRFLPNIPAGVISVELDDDVPLDAVRVGSKGMPAPTRDLRLFRVDRHGMAWSDFDADGDMDVFVNVGGALGMAPPTINDELLINEGGRFRAGAAAAGIDKQGSRGRRAEWVDYDGDGRLDVYLGNLKSANRLWAQGEDRRFSDRAPTLGLDLPGGDRFRWLDADRDGDADLVVAGRGGPARLFRNQGDRFDAEEIAESATEDPRQLALADFDADGDVDVLVVDTVNSRLLVAQGDSLVGNDPAELGLPAGALTAAWVDFDNDGRMDLHSVPGGLFRQGGDGRFEHAGLGVEKPPQDARCVWLDLDDDGDRDCLCELILDFYKVKHLAYRNDAASAHWLALDLSGPPANRQAIGATAVVETPGGRRTAHVVGESDSAHFSQGHYRIYLGLGAEERVKSIDITWPGGAVQRLEDVQGDRRVDVRFRQE